MALTKLNNASLSAVTSAGLPAGTVLQVVSTNFNDLLTYTSDDNSGAAGSLGGGFSVIPSQSHVNITSKKANSKFLVGFNGNMTCSTDSNIADWIGGFGMVVDPAGGTSWTQIGSGQNTNTSDNVKFFRSRADVTTAAANDTFWQMPLSSSVMYTSSVSAGTTLRFAIEYFHYVATQHQNLLINQINSGHGGTAPYAGTCATTVSVTEIAG
jgi:hypothetical protein